GGTSPSRGAGVVLDVTSQVAARRILVPDYTNVDAATAQAGLEALGLRVTVVYATGAPDGRVLSQAPPPSTEVPEGAVVTIQVARAAAPAERARRPGRGRAGAPPHPPAASPG